MFLFLDLWSRDHNHKNKYQNISPHFKNKIYIKNKRINNCINKKTINLRIKNIYIKQELKHKWINI